MKKTITLLLLLTCSLFVSSIFAQNISEDLSKLSYAELNKIMMDYYKKGEYPKIIPYAKWAMDKAGEEFGELDSRFITYVGNLALFYTNTGDYLEAERLYLKALSIDSIVLGVQHPKFSIRLNNLAILYYNKGDYQKAKTLYLQSINIDSSALGTEHPQFATSLNNLAQLYQDMGDYESSKLLNLRGIKIKEKKLNTVKQRLLNVFDTPNKKQRPFYAMVGCSKHSQLVRASTKYLYKDKNCRCHLVPNLKLFSELAEHSSIYATSLNNLASLYMDIGNYQEADSLFLQVKNITGKVSGELHPKYANSLNNLALLYSMIEKYEESELLYLQAIHLDSLVLGKNHPHFTLCLTNLASLYQKMERYQEAELLYLQVAGKGSITSLSNLAVLYQDMGRYEESERLYLDVLKIKKEKLGEHHASVAETLNNLANLYLTMKRYEESQLNYLQAKNICTKALGQEQPFFAKILNSLAVLYLEMGKLDSALQYCKLGIAANCLAIDNSFDNWSNLDTFNYYSNECIYYATKALLTILNAQYKKTNDKGKLEELYSIAKGIMRLNDRIRNDFNKNSNKLNVLSKEIQVIQFTIETALKLNEPIYLAEAFSFAERNKSILLADVIKSRKAFNSVSLGDLPDSVKLKELLLQKKHENLVPEEITAYTAQQQLITNQKRINLNVETEEFRKNLKINHPKYYKLKYKNITPSANDIQNILPDSTLFLEYFVSDSMTYIFALNKQEVKIYPIKITKTAIHNLVKKYQQYVASDSLIRAQKENDSYKGLSGISFELYSKILSPALEDFKKRMGIKNLVIIPDGELGHIAFESLISKPASTDKRWSSLHYVLNDYAISYHYSATLWKEGIDAEMLKENTQTMHKNTLLAMAPSYKKITDTTTYTTRMSIHRDSLTPLLFAKKDVENLAKAFVTKACIGDSVSSNLFQKIATNYNIIHIAAHAASNMEDPLKSCIAFTNINPLNDVFLEAWQISQLEFKNTNLIVLAACESGYGKFEQGEGIISLARAFMYAGVPSLVVSYWVVNDASTSEIMLSFYKNLNNMDKATALQQAKLNYIEKNKGLIKSHPFYWAPFAQLGKNNPLLLESRQ